MAHRLLDAGALPPVDVLASNVSLIAELLGEAIGEIREQRAELDQLESDLDGVFIYLGGILVFVMQAGFALLESGTVRSKNTKNILLKNILDACIGALTWWSIGHAFAYGVNGPAPNAFIGGQDFFASSDKGKSIHPFSAYSNNFWPLWLFNWAFAATASTIVSGAVAERCQIGAYIVYTIVLSGFIYPVVAHWVWSSEGWLSPYRHPASLGDHGMIDFAGSGVVHLTGGTAALVGAIFCGPRLGRFAEDGRVIDMPGHSTVLAALGTMFLWFGWFAFNTMSAGGAFGKINFAAKASVNTCISGAASACFALIFHVYNGGAPNIGPVLNGILGGMVAITGSCALVEPYGAFIIGMTASLVYLGGAKLLKMLKIDDPLDAAPVHMFCGAWGLIAVGPFVRRDLVSFFYGKTFEYGFLYGGGGKQLGIQILGVVAIAAWSGATSCIVFGILSKLGVLRTKMNDELMGLDLTHHGGSHLQVIQDKGKESKDKIGGIVHLANTA
eukprot:jgi/Mesvir1/23851/Mv10654-RA.1